MNIQQEIDPSCGNARSNAGLGQSPAAAGTASDRMDRPGYASCQAVIQFAGMYAVETELEHDGRWIAEVPELPGVMAYGKTRDEASRRAQALSLRVLADRLEHDEAIPQVQAVFSIVA